MNETTSNVGPAMATLITRYRQANSHLASEGYHDKDEDAVVAAAVAENEKLRAQVAWYRLLTRYVPVMFKEFVGHLQRGASIEGACRAMNSDAATKLPYCPVDGDNIPVETPELRAALEAALAGGKADE